MKPDKKDELASLVSRIAQAIEQARAQVRQSVNHAMVASYWEIGRLIVEHEHRERQGAAYGQRQLKSFQQGLPPCLARASQ